MYKNRKTIMLLVTLLLSAGFVAVGAIGTTSMEDRTADNSKQAANAFGLCVPEGPGGYQRTGLRIGSRCEESSKCETLVIHVTSDVIHGAGTTLAHVSDGLHTLCGPAMARRARVKLVTCTCGSCLAVSPNVVLFVYSLRATASRQKFKLIF